MGVKPFMFTGLVQDIGIIRGISHAGADTVLTVQTRFRDFVNGESIAVSGACLSVTNYSGDTFTAFASIETGRKTGIGDFKAGTRVNLERALRLGDPVGGHLVSGHVDTRISLLSRKAEGSAECFELSLPESDVAMEIAPKGSVTLDGVSLTVNRVLRDRFSVMIIPITLRETTLGDLRAGDKINLETDVIAKYIARQLSGRHSDGVDMSLLERAGFIR